MTEKINHSAEQYEGLSEQERNELEQSADKRRQELERHAHEQQPERGEATHEALEHARSAESERHREDEDTTHRHERKNHAPSKTERNEAYDTVMSEARSHMSPTSRAFSKIIHNPAIERSSDAVGATVARPNAILAGSFSAFVVVLVVYLIARYYGYPLSGTEAIASFAFGWIFGIVFDFLRVMITGKKA